MVSHSMCVCWQFYSTCVYWLWSPIACVCAGRFTVRVRTGYGLPQHVCVLAALQYMYVLVMVSRSTCVCWQSTVRVYTGHGLPRHVYVCWQSTLRVCTGHGLPQHVCVLVVLHYKCILVMVS